MPLSKTCRFSLKELELFKSIGLGGSIKSLNVRFKPFEKEVSEIDIWQMAANICFQQALLGPNIDAIHRGWCAIRIYSVKRLSAEFEKLIDKNTDYCKDCGMIYYNCLCGHADYEDE